MQKLRLSFLFLLSCSVLCGEIPYPHVMVTGDAVHEAAPDELDWQIEVRTKGSNVEAVTGHHLPSVSNLLAYINSFVDKESVQTSSMSYGEDYQWQNSSRVKTGYYALTHVRFTLKDISRYDLLWQHISRMKNVSITHVGYGHSNEDSIRDEVRIDALKNAESKAKSMAAALGSRVGEVLLIEDLSGQGHHPQPMRMTAMAERGGGGQSAIAPGLIEFRMQVKAAFRLHSD